MDPELPPCRPIKEVLEELYTWCKVRSVPKKIFCKPIKRIKQEGKPSQERIESLAKPFKMHIYVKPSKDPHHWRYLLKHPVKASALNYVASARTLQLSVPAPYNFHIKPEENPACWAYIMKHQVNPAALKYEATERINELARLPYFKLRKKYRKARRPKFYVSELALMAEATDRLIKLSKPVVHELPPKKEFAFKVNPLALKYRATCRIQCLALPKKPTVKCRCTCDCGFVKDSNCKE